MFSYALTKNGPFCSEPYVFTDAGTHTVWYKISAENYDDFVHEAQVKILPRAVTITSGTATRNYDGTALTCDDYEVQGLIGADGINVVCSGRQVEFGSSPNYFTHAFRPGTNGDNYTISSCYGTLTVTGAREFPAQRWPVRDSA